MADAPSIGGPDGFAPPIHQTNDAATLNQTQDGLHIPTIKTNNGQPTNVAPAYPNRPSKNDLSQWVHFIVRNRSSREKLAHANRLLSTVSGTDKCLMTLGYSLLTICSTLERFNIPTGKSTEDIAIITSTSDTRTKSIEMRLRNLSNLISDIRIFTRLWGLLGVAEWGVQTYEAPPKDRQLRQIAYAQVAVNIFYQILENLAYLSQHKVLKFSAAAQNKMWAWSCRFWAAHVVLDFAKLWRIRQARGRVVKGVTDSEEREWWRLFTTNLCYAPLTLHWSMENGGALSDFIVGLLGTTAGVLSLQHAWRQSA